MPDRATLIRLALEAGAAVEHGPFHAWSVEALPGPVEQIVFTVEQLQQFALAVKAE